MNGKSPMISHAPPFVLRLSKDERKVFQQNPNLIADPDPRSLVDRVEPNMRGVCNHVASQCLNLNDAVQDAVEQVRIEHALQGGASWC